MSGRATAAARARQAAELKSLRVSRHYLTPEIEARIVKALIARRDGSEWITQADLAKRFGVSQDTISNITMRHDVGIRRNGR